MKASSPIVLMLAGCRFKLEFTRNVVEVYKARDEAVTLTDTWKMEVLVPAGGQAAVSPGGMHLRLERSTETVATKRIAQLTPDFQSEKKQSLAWQVPGI